MDAKAILVHHPTSVLVALFKLAIKTPCKDGSINPLCIKICEVLNGKGYDVANLDFNDGKPSSSNRSSHSNEKNGKHEKRTSKNGKRSGILRLTNPGC